MEDSLQIITEEWPFYLRKESGPQWNEPTWVVYGTMSFDNPAVTMATYPCNKYKTERGVQKKFERDHTKEHTDGKEYFEDEDGKWLVDYKWTIVPSLGIEQAPRTAPKRTRTTPRKKPKVRKSKPVDELQARFASIILPSKDN